MQVVTLTAQGKDLWSQMHAEYRSVVDELLLPLSKMESNTLTKSLMRAQEKIDGVLQEASETALLAETKSTSSATKKQQQRGTGVRS